LDKHHKTPLHVAVVAMALSLLMPVASADAHNSVCETGREYVHAHIVPAAHDGILGQIHKPGSHRGFFGVPPVCPPSGS
jgi:hypothetical protein